MESGERWMKTLGETMGTAIPRRGTVIHLKGVRDALIQSLGIKFNPVFQFHFLSASDSIGYHFYCYSIPSSLAPSLQSALYHFRDHGILSVFLKKMVVWKYMVVIL